MSEPVDFSFSETEIAEIAAKWTPEQQAQLSVVTAAADSLVKAKVPYVLWFHTTPGWCQAVGINLSEQTRKEDWLRLCKLTGPALAFHSRCLGGHLSEHTPDGIAYAEYHKGEMRVLRQPTSEEQSTLTIVRDGS